VKLGQYISFFIGVTSYEQYIVYICFMRTFEVLFPSFLQ